MNVLPIRILPELRAIHLDQLDRFVPAEVAYLSENYDVAGLVIPRSARRTTVWSLLVRLARSRASVLELPEPLWVRFLPKWIFLAVTWKLSGIALRRPRRAVFYAMENNDLSTLIGGVGGAPRVVVGIFRFAVGAVIRLLVDRMCFATPASCATYRTLRFTRGIPQRVTLELPAPAVRTVAPDPSDRTVVFVGVLEERKGVLLLLEAWEKVEREVAGSVLHLVGPGSLSGFVDEWVARSPSSRRRSEQLPRAAVLDLIQTAIVLVSPSIPWGRSREQVCLPIKEALASGLTIVASRQTGLADWLVDHGHRVVELSDLGARFVTALSDDIASALREPLDQADVRASLPSLEGWQQADLWLHRPFHEY